MWRLTKEEIERHPRYWIDSLVREHGCEILQLPPRHCELNPIEMAWAKVRLYLARVSRQKMGPHKVTIPLCNVCKNMSKKMADHPYLFLCSISFTWMDSGHIENGGWLFLNSVKMQRLREFIK